MCDKENSQVQPRQKMTDLVPATACKKPEADAKKNSAVTKIVFFCTNNLLQNAPKCSQNWRITEILQKKSNDSSEQWSKPDIPL